MRKKPNRVAFTNNMKMRLVQNALLFFFLFVDYGYAWFVYIA